MNISGLGIRTSAIQSEMDSVVKSIQSQIDSAKKQLQEINSDTELTDQEKLTKRQELQQQIADLNNQLRDYQSQVRQTKQQDNNQEDGDKIELSSQGRLMSNDPSMQQLNLNKSILNKLDDSKELDEKQDLLKDKEIEDKNKDLEKLKENIKIENRAVNLYKEVLNITGQNEEEKPQDYNSLDVQV
jgi:hypothetical protein